MRKVKLIIYYFISCFRKGPAFSGKNCMNILLPFLCYSLFAICYLFPAICSAQQSITWQRIYHGPSNYWDVGNDICSTYNGNFYVVGITFLTPPPVTQKAYVIKLNKYGDEVWAKIVLQGGGSAITNTNDGGCVVTGSYDQASATKLDSMGNIVWNRTYGGSAIQCYNIIRTSDGGYIACGSDENVKIDGYILKIDSLGNLQWQQVYPSFELKSFHSIIEINGVGYVTTGVVWDLPMGDTAECLLMKVDLSGNLLWEKRYKIQNRQSGGRTLINLENKFLIGGGLRDSLGVIGYPYMIRTDTSGNLIFTKIFSSTQQEYYGDLRVINENRYVISSERDSIGTSYMIVDAKITDSLGNILQRKTYGYGRYVEIRKILPLSNGDIMFAGLVESFQPRSYFYVIRSDSILNAPPIGIEPTEKEIPENFELYQNFPNPFNAKSRIKYQIAKTSYVVLQVFDAGGRHIRTLVNGEQIPGVHLAEFDGTDLASAIYLYRIMAGSFAETKKMALIK